MYNIYIYIYRKMCALLFKNTKKIWRASFTINIYTIVKTDKNYTKKVRGQDNTEEWCWKFIFILCVCCCFFFLFGLIFIYAIISIGSLRIYNKYNFVTNTNTLFSMVYAMCCSVGWIGKCPIWWNNIHKRDKDLPYLWPFVNRFWFNFRFFGFRFKYQLIVNCDSRPSLIIYKC